MSADSPDLNAFAARLAALQPTTGLSRDQIMYQAGRRSAKRTNAWPFASLALAGLVLWFAAKPATVVESVRLVDRSTQSGTYVRGKKWDSNNNYLHLRDTALRMGVESLPMPNPNSESVSICTPRSIADFLN